MSDDTSEPTGASTRREYVKYGGAVIGGGLLAGCTGVKDPDSTRTPTDGAGDGSAETATQADEATGTGMPADQSAQTDTKARPTAADSYSVSIEPVGSVTFEEVPERWLAMTATWADMGIALGQQPPEGVVSTSRYHTHHYDDVPGLSVSKDDITQLYDAGIDKELFYEIDADVHVFDPNFLTNRVENIDDSDIDELASAVGPFFGNAIFSRNYAWHDGYRYYTLYEAFEKLAKVFHAEARYEAFAQLHDEVLGAVADRLPPQSERPSVACLMVVSETPEEFYPFRIEEGTGWKQWRDLGVTDGLAGTGVETFTAARATISYETLLDADPEYLMLYGFESLGAEQFRDTFLPFFRDHDTASQLTAVQEGNVYRAGSFYQGPIVNLSLTERAAKQLYPEQFPADERLYDRQRVANIINGDS
ncbi:ABC transporter substrate-binding protein [Halosimplex sp. J119]